MEPSRLTAARAAPGTNLCFWLRTRRIRSHHWSDLRFGICALYVVQDHPAYIPRVAIAPLFYLSVVARTVQGMARVRSGQAPAWPLVSDRSVRRDSRIKRDFACTFTSQFPLCSLSCGHSHA